MSCFRTTRRTQFFVWWSSRARYSPEQFFTTPLDQGPKPQKHDLALATPGAVIPLKTQLFPHFHGFTRKITRSLTGTGIYCFTSQLYTWYYLVVYSTWLCEDYPWPVIWLSMGIWGDVKRGSIAKNRLLGHGLASQQRWLTPVAGCSGWSSLGFKLKVLSRSTARSASRYLWDPLGSSGRLSCYVLSLEYCNMPPLRSPQPVQSFPTEVPR